LAGWLVGWLAGWLVGWLAVGGASSPDLPRRIYDRKRFEPQMDADFCNVLEGPDLLSLYLRSSAFICGKK
ncbi:MAG: hypothetical protein WD397_17145, partial [Wenzhouxiangellaceae bacterium]